MRARERAFLSLNDEDDRDEDDHVSPVKFRWKIFVGGEILLRRSRGAAGQPILQLRGSERYPAAGAAIFRG